jgi:hypothetical protein
MFETVHERNSAHEKGIASALLAVAVAGGAAVATTGTAHASDRKSGGCRYDYAYVIDGYSLKPCVGYASALHYVNGSIAVKIAPHSPDVQVCGEMVPVTDGSNLVGPEHCTTVYGDENVTSYTTAGQFWNERFQPTFGGVDTDYVYKTYIKVNGHTYGDVESPRITYYWS